jgi:two-component system response regulator RegA
MTTPATPPKFDPKTDPRVLIVDDEPRMRELLNRAVGGWGFDVTTAKSGEEALRLAAEHPPHIALLDLDLPGIGGLETFTKLRERQPDLQGIILTGFGSLDAARQAIHLDVVEFLTKPAPLGDLEHALDRAIRRLAPVLPTPPIILDIMQGATDDGGAEAGQTLAEVERRHILETLTRNNGNRTATATELGISRRTLYYKLAEYQKDGFLTD